MSEHLDTIVTGVLTLFGFVIQHLHFEKKLTLRDKRDLFLRTTDEPMCQVLRDLDRCIATARVLKKSQSNELQDALLQSLFQASRELDRLLVRNSKGIFDSGENGWISISVEALDDQISQFDEGRQVSALIGIIKEVEALNRAIKPVLDGCRASSGL